tara:strand:+ start:546 stop:1010 length:465 start_codon:yes stop_codon:yes gene_type:complete
MSNSKEKECPDCNCPKCPEPQCPPQITMEDIIKAVMPGKSPFYTFGEFHMNGKNVDSETSIDGTDRWDGLYMFNLQPQPYNPSAQGIMPYSGEISDEYRPVKLDTVEDMFNLEEAVDYRVDRKIVEQIRYPGRTRNNGMAERGGNNVNTDTIDE